MTLKAILSLTGSMVSIVMVMGVAASNGECGTPEPTEEHIAMAKEMALNESMISTSEFAALANIEVPVYVHVVSKSNNEHPTDENVRAMITGMTKDYDNMGFQFALESVDYTVNADWSSSKNEMAMKKKLRKGGYATLNLYYVNSMPSSSSSRLNGFCTYPTNGGKGGDTLTRDGCTIRHDLLNNGQTTTHEVGHWL